MSPRRAPSFARATFAVLRLQALRLRRGKKLRLALIATSFVVIAAIVTRYSVPDPDATLTVESTINVGFFGFLAYLLPFLLQAGAIAEEVEGRTFTYVAGRPTGRFAMTLGKWLAGTLFAWGALLAGVLLLHLGAHAATPDTLVETLPTTAKAAGSLALLVTYYGAICFFWGALLPEAAGILSLLHLAIIEFGFGKLFGVVRLASMNYHAEQIAGLPRDGLLAESVPEIDPWWSVLAILVHTALFLGLAAVVVRVQEYRFSKA
jgi:ABC-type transport system involved in multi-copper enzyme maturation permease subunit